MRRRLRIVLVATAIIAPALIVVPQQVQAYPQDPFPCADASRKFNFHWDWDTTWSLQKNWASDAFELWNRPIEYDGTPLVSVSEGVDDIVVYAADLPSNANGSAACGPVAGPVIEINTDYMSDYKFVYKVARHEMGHLLGMEHSGWGHGGDLILPTMATCVPHSSFPSTNVLSVDDFAYLTWLHSSPEYRQLISNYGFERGREHWNIAGGTWEALATGGAGGIKRIRYKTANDAQYIYAAPVVVATGDDDLMYRSVIQYKVDAFGHTGSVEGRLYREQLTFPYDNGCSYEDGLDNLNDWWSISPAPVLLATTGAQTTTNKTSWLKITGPFVNPAQADGYRFEYRVYAHTEENGVDDWVYLDNLRAEGQ